MADNLYLILHKVRGEPAFDIAQRLEATEGGSTADPWWIIPTSGHRAHPCWTYPLLDLYSHPDTGSLCPLELWGGTLPPELPDHYAASEPRSVPAARRVTPVPATATEDFVL